MTRMKPLLVCAGVVGAWSAWIVTQRATSPDVSVVTATPAARPTSPSSAPPPDAAQAVAIGARPAMAASATPADSGDAFAIRDWAPPPAPPPPPPPVVSAPPPPPAPPPAPTLPYRLVGIAEAGLYSAPHVFLSLDNKLLIAAAGDTLEGGYRLDSITPRELVFTHLQLNLQMRLSVQGASS